MNKTYILGWFFVNDVNSCARGWNSVKFDNLMESKEWSSRYNVPLEMVYRVVDGKIAETLYMSEKGLSEYKRVQERKREEAERQRRCRNLYVDFVNGHRYI